MLEILTEHSNTTVFLATCTVVVQFNSPNREAEYCDEPVCLSVCLCMSVCVCLSAIISSELHVRSSPIFLCTLPMAVAQSCSGSGVIRYALPVWRMTSYVHIGELAARRRRQAEAVRPTRTQPWAWRVGIRAADAWDYFLQSWPTQQN